MSTFKKITGIAGSLFLAVGILSACSEDATTTENEGTNEQSNEPTLEAQFTQDGNTVTIDWSTSITVSAENYGADHVEGEGHAHVYVDGEKVAGLKNTDAYTVEGLSAGKHTIEIALQRNDHEAYEVSKSFEVEVSEEDGAPTLEAEFVQDGNNVTITWSTSLVISAVNYGADHVVGEGHAHVYVDGEKVAGLKNTDAYTVEGLSAGKHTIELTLQRNDHDSYEVSESFEVEVTE
jgi:hypothetical protein